MNYPKPTLAVDIALITVKGGKLKCLLVRREDASTVGGTWALPGGFVHEDKSLDDIVNKVLVEKVGLDNIYFEQLRAYGALHRDPRMRVVSITHLALVPHTYISSALATNSELIVADIIVDWAGETGGAASVFSDEYGSLNLAFDHADIIGDVVKRLRGKLDYSDVGLELLPKHFTLRDAQEIHEAILGRSLTKPAFRRKLVDRGIIKPTGKQETASAFRPAELYTKTK